MLSINISFRKAVKKTKEGRKDCFPLAQNIMKQEFFAFSAEDLPVHSAVLSWGPVNRRNGSNDKEGNAAMLKENLVMLRNTYGFSQEEIAWS